MQAVGGAARLATVLFESDDFLFKLQYINGTVFSFIILAQFFYYWNSTSAKNKVAQAKKAQ